MIISRILFAVTAIPFVLASKGGGSGCSSSQFQFVSRFFVLVCSTLTLHIDGTLKTAVFHTEDLLNRNLPQRAANVPPIGLGIRTKAAARPTSLPRIFLPLSATMGGAGLMHPTVAAHPVNLLPLAITILLPFQMAVETETVTSVLVPLVGPVNVRLPNSSSYSVSSIYPILNIINRWDAKDCCLPYGGPSPTESPPKGSECPSNWSWKSDKGCCAPHQPPQNLPPPQCDNGWVWSDATYCCSAPGQPTTPGNNNPSSIPNGGGNGNRYRRSRPIGRSSQCSSSEFRFASLFLL
jgi:hypothetical protein